MISEHIVIAITKIKAVITQRSKLIFIICYLCLARLKTWECLARCFLLQKKLLQHPPFLVQGMVVKVC